MHFTTLAFYNIGVLQHWRFTTLAFYNMGILQQWHFTTLAPFISAGIAITTAVTTASKIEALTTIFVLQKNVF
jgi:hypothetical protein